MSLQIRTFVQGQPKFLDLYKDEPVLLSLSFAEVQDITKKNSAFSKGFSVPGSQRNNEIFNFFYDLNSVPVTFNPNNKFDAQLLWDGYEILQGHIRLNGVSITNDEIIYQVTFYNQIGDLAANIGDKYLRNLNLSALTHPYSEEVVLESILDPTLFNLTGNTNYSYQDGRTFWGLYNIGYEYISGTTINEEVSPLIQFTPLLSGNTGPVYFPVSGNFDFSGTPVRDYYYKPTLQIKTLYEKICEEAGYEIQSDFFNTDYFKKFYMPLKFLDETVYAKNAIQACYKYGPQDYNLTNITITSYTTANSGVTCNTLGFPLTNTGFTIDEQYQQLYTFRFSFNLVLGNCDYFTLSIPTLWFGYTDGTQSQYLYQNQWCDDAPQVISIEQTFNITGTSSIAFFLQGEFLQVSGFTAEIINGPRFIPSGATINYAEEFPDNDYTQIDFITSINKYFNLVIVPNPDKPRSLIVEPIIDYIGKGRTLDWTTKISSNEIQSLYPTSSLINGTLDFEFKLDQDYANQDFNSRANRIFGTDKFKLNLEYKDEVTKFTYIFSSPIDITVQNAYIPLITVGSMSKVKTVDRDGQSLQTFVPFKILPKLIFRGLTLPNDNWGFVGGVTTVSGDTTCKSGVTINVTSQGWVKWNDCFGDTIYDFFPTGSHIIPDCINVTSVTAGFPYLQVASFNTSSSGSTCGLVVEPAQHQTYWINDVQIDRFNNLNRFTTYPFAYNGLSHYINFRGEDKTNITPEEFSFVQPDLYDIYYKPYVDDLISEENKIYSAKIYLYPQEIQQLRWNERILINNTYFRINRITNFNMTEPSVCDIELVKLTKEYEGHRVLYYDLIPCESGNTEYHSNSDLMYHLYAYAGNFVTLFDDDLNYLGCYNVQIGSYNSGYTYEHFYISSGYTNQLVGVYPDCGCTGRTPFNLVQEEPFDIRYFVYRGTECNGSTQYIFRSTGTSLDDTGLVYRIYNPVIFDDVCVSGITSYFSVLTDWTEQGSFSGCSDCNCIECYSYSMTANTTGLVSWLDCDGILNDTFLLVGETYQIPCIGARGGTVNGDVTLSAGTLCFNSCVTPTPTPTNQATPTPTPTIPVTPTQTPTPNVTPTPSQTEPAISCRVYMNETAFSWLGDYQDCNLTWYYSTYIAPGGSICAVLGSPFTLGGSPLTETSISCQP